MSGKPWNLDTFLEHQRSMRKRHTQWREAEPSGWHGYGGGEYEEQYQEYPQPVRYYTLIDVLSREFLLVRVRLFSVSFECAMNKFLFNKNNCAVFYYLFRSMKFRSG